MVKPLKKVVKLKKHKATFRRHQSDTNVSVPVRRIYGRLSPKPIQTFGVQTLSRP